MFLLGWFFDFDFLCRGLLAVLQVRHAARNGYGVFVRSNKDVGESRLVYVAACPGRWHIQKLAGLVFGDEPCVPSVNGFHLVELLVSRHDVVVAPDEVVAEKREKLLVYGVLASA